MRPNLHVCVKYSAEKKVVPAKSKALIDTQISIAVPKGCYGRVAPRSGLGAGVIDSDYRGIVFVLLFNHSDSDFEIVEGDRVAQLIIEKIETPDVVEVNKPRIERAHADDTPD
ncbi:dUTP diphosphatase [Sanghuangporus baumii]|uniref:Deoxyuridine 5'-triphosphate nucleotidohydrolase n=1 Tax=Sanghuangporus baumii TaxID=108892 RepID=A0A9Q5N4F6_SANBA|nr:dUTP diphosphatase [Sanghuangporus baumii]